MAKQQEKAYRALVGINYVPDGEENEKRVEPGDKITDMSENAIRHELAAKNVEEWEPRHTENVRTEEQEKEQSEVTGVTSRRNHGAIDMQEVGE